VRTSLASWTAAVVLLATSAHAQAPVQRLGGSIRANPPSGPVPRLPDGKPDMSGVWLGGLPVGDISAALAKGEAMPLLSETRKRMEAQKADDDPQAHCLPLPPPRFTPYPWRMVVTPTHVFFLYEMFNYRQVFMDGRKHPDEPDPTWYGHSIGRWEGDTLVVDTINFKPQVNFRGSSENLHVIERFTRTDANTILYKFTIDDPTTWTKPWSAEIPLHVTDERLYEYACHEANYGLEGVLRGARAQEKREEETSQSKKK